MHNFDESRVMAYLGAIVIRFCVIKPPMSPFSVFVDNLSITSGVFAVAGRHGSVFLALALGTPLYMEVFNGPITMGCPLSCPFDRLLFYFVFSSFFFHE